MRYSGVVVKAFVGSRKTIIGEVDLLTKIGLSDFHITFQVMDIHSTYRCLLGRSWIHEADVVTSTLHQKLKFVKNGKLVIVGGVKVLLEAIYHLSPTLKPKKLFGTPFQALSVANEIQMTGVSMSSLKDAQEVVRAGGTDKWGRVMEVVENKNMIGLGFQQGPFKGEVKAM